MKAWISVLILLVGLNVQSIQAQIRKGAAGVGKKRNVSTQTTPVETKGGITTTTTPSTSPITTTPRPVSTQTTTATNGGFVKGTTTTIPEGTGGIKPVNGVGEPVKPRPELQQILTPQQMTQVEQVIVKNETGTTNWSDGYIEATGKCFIDRTKFKIPGQAEELAKTGADAIARRNLLAQVEKVRIIDTVTIVNQVFDRQVTKQILDGYIRNAYRIGNYNVTENYVEVTFRMNLHEGENSVASAAAKAIEKAVSDGKTINGQGATVQNPQEIAQLQTQLQQEMQTQGLNANDPLLLNVTSQNGQPSLFPTIKFVTEDGKEVSIPTAPFLNGNSQVKNAAGQVMPYFKLTKDILKQLNIKGQPLLNAIIDYDGSIKVNVKDQPKGAKILEVLKKVGPWVLKLLPTLVALF